MKRKPVIIAILTLLGISSYFLWAKSSVREGTDPENDFANWKPTAEAIRLQLPEGTQAERETAFAKLFQNRFRKHDPGKAIGVHILPGAKINLLTPARLEPWNIDRIALMLHQEARKNFNKTYHIDIFETFIGTPPIKIGEACPSPKAPEQIVLSYHYPNLAHYKSITVEAQLQGKTPQPRAGGISTIILTRPRPQPPQPPL